MKKSNEESYANKQKSLVKYPKLKSQKSSRQEDVKEATNGKEDGAEEEEKFKLTRPTTYKVEPLVDDRCLL